MPSTGPIDDDLIVEEKLPTSLWKWTCATNAFDASAAEDGGLQGHGPCPDDVSAHSHHTVPNALVQAPSDVYVIRSSQGVGEQPDDIATHDPVPASRVQAHNLYIGGAFPDGALELSSILTQQSAGPFDDDDVMIRPASPERLSTCDETAVPAVAVLPDTAHVSAMRHGKPVTHDVPAAGGCLLFFFFSVGRHARLVLGRGTRARHKKLLFLATCQR